MVTSMLIKSPSVTFYLKIFRSILYILFCLSADKLVISVDKIKLYSL